MVTGHKAALAWNFNFVELQFYMKKLQFWESQQFMIKSCTTKLGGQSYEKFGDSAKFTIL